MKTKQTRQNKTRQDKANAKLYEVGSRHTIMVLITYT